MSTDTAKKPLEAAEESQMPEYYAYRIFPPERIEARLNEARERGWSLHTFCDATEETWPSAVFQWAGEEDRIQPFEDDEEGN